MLLNIEKSGEQDLQRSGEWLVNTNPGSFVTKHSRKHSYSLSPRFCKFESNTISDWLNCAALFITTTTYNLNCLLNTIIMLMAFLTLGTVKA